MNFKTSLKNVAIIILNYNSADLTIKAANYLLQFETELQLIIVDNCSKDSSQQKLELEFTNVKNVHLVFNDTNFGYAHGNNIGITYAEKLSNIEFITIMNPDVIVDAETLGILREVLQRSKTIGFITAETYYNGRYMTPNECAWKLPTTGQLMIFCTVLGYLCRHFLTRFRFKFNFQNYYETEHYQDKKLAYVDVVQGCFFMGKLKTFFEVGKLDENTFLYYEENILGEKVSRIGKKNAVLVGHYIQHNHQVKDASLIKRSNKIFDMTCIHNSRDYFIREYFDANSIVKLFLRGFLKLDFCLRKAVVNITFND